MTRFSKNRHLEAIRLLTDVPKHDQNTVPMKDEKQRPTGESNNLAAMSNNQHKVNLGKTGTAR
jgi:hypothetical protein